MKNSPAIMSLPPYKHMRNPCLQTWVEPLIPGLAGAPLITHRSVQEKRRTSDQRIAKIQNFPGVEFEYEYVPAQTAVPPKEKTMLKPEIVEHHHHKNSQSKSVDFKYQDQRDLPAASGDQPRNLKDINECDRRNQAENGVTKKSVDQRDFKVTNDDAVSTCSRRSSISHCSQRSRKTSSSKSKETRKRSDSRESISSTVNAVLKTQSRKGEKYEGKLRFQKFGRIANGLDDDDLRTRRR